MDFTKINKETIQNQITKLSYIICGLYNNKL